MLAALGNQAIPKPPPPLLWHLAPCHCDCDAGTTQDSGAVDTFQNNPAILCTQTSLATATTPRHHLCTRARISLYLTVYFLSTDFHG